MRFPGGKIFLIFLCLAFASNPCKGKDPYDLGKVQILGKDAQSREITPELPEIPLEIGDKKEPLPEIASETLNLIPPIGKVEPLPNVTPAQSKAKNLKLDYARGTRGWEKTEFSAQGVQSGYTANFDIFREFRDAYKTTIRTQKSVFEGSLKFSEQENHDLEGTVSVSKNQFGLRGTNAILTPKIGIKDDGTSIKLKGQSTLSDGALLTCNGDFSQISRNTGNNGLSFNEDSNLSSSRFDAEYKFSVNSQSTAKATLNLFKDDYSIENGSRLGLTKRMFAFSGEFELQERAYLEFGLKSSNLMDRERTSPVVKLDLRSNSPWQAIFSYDENLGNDDLKKLFMPEYHVSIAPLKASLKKDFNFRLNYQAQEGLHLGGEIFRDKEEDGVELNDQYLTKQKVWTQNVSTVPKVVRNGFSLYGQADLDDNLKLKIKSTIQDPTNESVGRQLAYEPKRMLEVSAEYKAEKFEMEFVRNAKFDLKTYFPGSTENWDYSRSDISCKYHFNTNLTMYLSIQDLYNESKSLRYNVPEEGRLSLAGLDMNF
ncbi:MAG: TonB-dependent receptor [Candidatus Riflebacteria bacterium]|nr:TonB-dependent receptor [Candidatus Riflebacteria bacterium]